MSDKVGISKIVWASYTLLRNDSEMLEPFVRHHCGMLDGMFFIDDRSTDETLNILNCLKKEGLPVFLLSTETPFALWEYERQIERVRRECPVEFILPLHVNEYLVRETGAADLRALGVTDSSAGVNFFCTAKGFPDPVDCVTPVFRAVRGKNGQECAETVSGWRIFEIPPFSKAAYKMKCCVYTLDGLAGRREEFCRFVLWQNAFEKLKSDPMDSATVLMPENAVFVELGLSLQERRYAPKKTASADATKDILEFCEHFVDAYRQRILQKWPELDEQNRLEKIEYEIGILQRTRSWQLTLPLRRLESRLKRIVGLRCDET